MRKLIILLFLFVSFKVCSQIGIGNKWNGHYYIPMNFVFNGLYFTLSNVPQVKIPPQEGTMLHIVGYDNTSNTRLTIDAYSSTVRGAALTFRRLRGDTLNPLPPLANNVIGSINADGYGTDRFLNSSSGGLVIWTRENFSNTNRGTYVTIQATSSGDTVNMERMRIDQDGITLSNVIYPIGTVGVDSQLVKLPNGRWGLVAPQLSGGGTWGSITGTLSSQTDLQAALDAKMNSTDLSIYKTITAFNADTIALASDIDIADLKGRFVTKVNLSDTSTFATNTDISDLYLKNGLKLNITDTTELFAKRDSNALHYVKFTNKVDVSQLNNYKTISSFNIDSVSFASNADIADVYAKILLKTNLSDTATFATNNDITDANNKIGLKVNIADTSAFASNADYADALTKITLKTNISDTSSFARDNDIADLQAKINTKQPTGSYLTSEVDGSVTNEIQTLGLTTNVLSISSSNSVNLTKANVSGVENVDNTSDANKPVSTAGQTALNLKLNISDTTNLANGIRNSTPPVVYTNANTSYTLAAAFPSVVTTRANVTGWSHSITAGKRYLIRVVGTHQTAATTTGGSIGFVLASGTLTSAQGYIRMGASNLQAATEVSIPIYLINTTNTTVGSFITTTGVTTINTPHHIDIEFTLNCLTSGVLNVQWASEVAASSAQINSGAEFIVTQLN